MRQASLIILQEDLLTILKELPSSKNKPKEILEYIINESSKYPLKRSVVLTRKSTRNKLESISTVNVEQFNRILNSERHKAHHRGITQIFKKDRNYPLLCEITEVACEFGRTFEINMHDAFKAYCRIGIKKIGRNYRLNKFRTHNEYIHLAYEKELAVKENQFPKQTEELLFAYLKKMGITDKAQAKNIWESYCHDFVYATEQLLNSDTTVSIWINCQFKGMEYLEVKPEPYQLHGEEANKRYLIKGKMSNDNWRDGAIKRKAKQKKDYI